MSRLFAALWLLVSPRVEACVIQNSDSGVCRLAQDISASMPFCGSIVTYEACVPREVPWYPNVTTAVKDAWVGSTYSAAVARRKAIELRQLIPVDPTLFDYYYNVPPTSRFTSVTGSDCIEAYRRFFCYLNFPRCDGGGRSMLMCRSVCENFFTACGYPKILWRCYEPMYYGAKTPEGLNNDQSFDPEGAAIFLRAPFPGLPFQDNDFVRDSEGRYTTVSLPVCTPGIDGGAAAQRIAAAALAAAILLAAANVRA